MRHAILWASSVVILTCAIAANAAPHQLRGRYAVTGLSYCLEAPNGFNENLQPINSKYFINAYSLLGTVTYNGDGTGTAEGRHVTTTTPLPLGGGPIPPGVTTNNFSLKFTYAIDANGILTAEAVPGSFTGTILTGPRANQTFTADKLTLSGLISEDKKVLAVATTTPEVVTITFSNGDVAHEICHRSHVDVLLEERSGNSDKDK